jgi:hypothetical protein
VVLSGHIASGPIVAASSKFVDWIRRRDRTLVALEMEAAGLMGALYARLDVALALVIRGISDFGDERKSQIDATEGGLYRRVAMNNVRTRPTKTALFDAGYSAKRVTLSLALRSSGDAGRSFGRG